MFELEAVEDGGLGSRPAVAAVGGGPAALAAVVAEADDELERSPGTAAAAQLLCLPLVGTTCGGIPAEW